MAADVHIRQEFRTRRVAGGALIFIALPLTLMWVRFGLPPQFVFADLLFVLAGPGLFLFGLWAAFPQRPPAVVLLISDDRLVVHPGAREIVMPLDALIRITKDNPLTDNYDRLIFETADAETQLNVAQMTHEAADIIALVSIRLECQGRYLVEVRSDVLGALTGVWEVATGNPFEKSG